MASRTQYFAEYKDRVTFFDESIMLGRILNRILSVQYP